MTTKRQIVLQAFKNTSLAAYVFDLRPEELQDAVTELDQMMAMWAANDVNLGYVVGDELDDESGIALANLPAVVSNLAMTICTLFGRQPPAALAANAAQSYAGLLTQAMINVDATRPMQGHIPYGAGNRRLGTPGPVFIPADSTTPLQQRPGNGDLVLGG